MSLWFGVNGGQGFLVTNILQNTFFLFCRKKEGIQVDAVTSWKNCSFLMRLSYALHYNTLKTIVTKVVKNQHIHRTISGLSIFLCSGTFCCDTRCVKQCRWIIECIWNIYGNGISYSSLCVWNWSWGLASLLNFSIWLSVFVKETGGVIFFEVQRWSRNNVRARYLLTKCPRSTAQRRIPVVCSRLKPRENFREGKFPLNWLSATVLRCNDFTNTSNRMLY